MPDESSFYYSSLNKHFEWPLMFQVMIFCTQYWFFCLFAKSRRGCYWHWWRCQIFTLIRSLLPSISKPGCIFNLRHKSYWNYDLDTQSKPEPKNVCASTLLDKHVQILKLNALVGTWNIFATSRPSFCTDLILEIFSALCLIKLVFGHSLIRCNLNLARKLFRTVDIRTFFYSVTTHDE